MAARSDSDSKSAFPPISYRPKKAAQMLGISRAHLYKLLKAKKIPVRRDGAIRTIDHEALVAYRNSLPMVEPDTKPTGPLLPHDQQQLAIERARESDEPRAEEPKRKPDDEQPESKLDLAGIVEARRKLLAVNLGEDEGRLRALEFAINECRRHTGCTPEQAKAAVLRALSRSKEKP